MVMLKRGVSSSPLDVMEAMELYCFQKCRWQTLQQLWHVTVPMLKSWALTWTNTICGCQEWKPCWSGRNRYPGWWMLLADIGTGSAIWTRSSAGPNLVTWETAADVRKRRELPPARRWGRRRLVRCSNLSYNLLIWTIDYELVVWVYIPRCCKNAGFGPVGSWNLQRTGTGVFSRWNSKNIFGLYGMADTVTVTEPPN